MSDDDSKIRRIDLSPRYRFLKDRKSNGSSGGGMSSDMPTTVTIAEWEVAVVLRALSNDLQVAIAESDGRDDGLVEYIKILSGVILRLEEANGGSA